MVRVSLIANAFSQTPHPNNTKEHATLHIFGPQTFHRRVLAKINYNEYLTE